MKIEEGGRERREQREVSLFDSARLVCSIADFPRLTSQLAKRGVVSSNVPYELTLYMVSRKVAKERLTRRLVG